VYAAVHGSRTATSAAFMVRAETSARQVIWSEGDVFFMKNKRKRMIQGVWRTRVTSSSTFVVIRSSTVSV
jgi:hypothetical protein